MFLKVRSCDFQGRFQHCCVCHAANIVCNSRDPWPATAGLTQIYKIHFSCHTFRGACKTFQFVSETPKNNVRLPNHCCICNKRAFLRQCCSRHRLRAAAQLHPRSSSRLRAGARHAVLAAAVCVCGSPGPRAGHGPRGGGCALPRELSMEILITLCDRAH